MSSKPRHSASASTPSNTSKLPKFLQSKQTRDRSRSMIDPASSVVRSSSHNSSVILEAQASPSSSQTPRRSLIRKTSKLSGVKEASSPSHDADVSEDFSTADDSTDEPPIIVEPVSPRVRMRPERPLSSVSDNHLSYYQSSPSHSTTRLSDIPTRLSGWFQHAFNSSSTDLSLPHLINTGHIPPTSNSPKGKSSALLTAAKHGKGHLDKAMRYLLDSDSTPDKCTDPIWLLGVQHPGYEPPPAEPASPTTLSRSGSVNSRRASSFRTTTSSTVTAAPISSNALSSSQTSSSKNPAAHWPPEFYADFTSRVWITYRSHFHPIRDSSLTVLEREQVEAAVAAAAGTPTPISSSPPSKRWWPGGEKGWTSDAGWGCMLRTGQTLLATALVHLHLGRDWRRPPHPVYTADYATYVQILTWFFDSPSTLCPFSVHRMALAGKELGKDVGQWFGPSTAAGAIKSLVQNFPEASLGISVAVDGQIFQTDVYSASHSPTQSPRPRKLSRWGGRAVVVLIGIRLGLDGVNPIYYETIKALYTFPQLVGIAGGRPASSYYFVGSQADNLFYLDPHHSRPTIPLRPPPQSAEGERERGIPIRQATPERGSVSPPLHHRSPTSPASSRTGSSTFSYHATPSPSPLSKELSTSSSSSGGAHVRWHSTGANGGGGSELSGAASDVGLDPTQMHYVTAYSATDLRTFHCDRVRKMPLSGLDPSMLIGFLCKTEADWIDLRRRVAELFKNHKTIFSIVDEPPSWSDADDSLESMSDPDEEEDMPDDKDSSRSGVGDEDGDTREDDEDSDGDFFDAGDAIIGDRFSLRAASESGQSGGGTEDDPVGPVTPSAAPPMSGGTISRKPNAVDFSRTISADSGDLDDEEWVDPTPIPPTPLEPVPPAFPPAMIAKTKSSSSAKSRKRKEARATVPVPFPSSVAEGAPEDRPRRVPQMSTARGRDGGRTQSGGVKGVITPDPGPAEPDDPDVDDF
ncbi:hypothetical protein EDB85DRAFT_532534 [Lactarius pseudohatsudake]|nr:hypothetical protein EDB85DRAFT_532534 [Lactarius pseudohatsudake]